MVTGWSLADLSGEDAWRLKLSHSVSRKVLIHITRGQGSISIRGWNYDLSQQSVVLLPENTLFSVDLSDKSMGRMVILPEPGQTLLPHDPIVQKIAQIDAQAELDGFLKAIQKESANPQELTLDALEAHINLLSVWLRRQLSLKSGTDPVKTAGRRLMERYTKLLTEEFASTQVMADYAHKLNVTPTHLTRVSRECCGRTAADLLTERVLHAARTELEQETPPIKVISQKLGFSSAAYFTRFVLKHTGKTPSALRRFALSRDIR